MLRLNCGAGLSDYIDTTSKAFEAATKPSTQSKGNLEEDEEVVIPLPSDDRNERPRKLKNHTSKL
jgi:hypothetical protein